MRFDLTVNVRRFWHNERGASAVEFALVSVPFIALLLFAIQAIIIYFADAALETYTDDVARRLLTGATQQLALTAPLFKTQLCSSLPSLFVSGVANPPSGTLPEHG